MRDFAQIAAGISRGAADRLAAEGFAVVDGLLGGDWATALLREMESLVDGGPAPASDRSNALASALTR